MNLSYWDQALLETSYDLLVVGGGFTGCFTALFYAQANPGARVAVLSRNHHEAASRRNAGFLCYGSLSELYDYEDGTLIELVSRRYQGMELMLRTLGRESIDYNPCGGREFFSQAQRELFQTLRLRIDALNALMASTGLAETDFWQEATDDTMSIDMPLEGAINPAMAHNRLMRLCQEWGVNILHNHEVSAYDANPKQLCLELKSGAKIMSESIVLATNGLCTRLSTSERRPVRNQVIVTNPIDHNLSDRVYHHDQGYVYYRPLDGGRVLIGGARNRFMDTSETDELAIDHNVENHLLDFLSEHITSKRPEIEHSWSGILAMDTHAEPSARLIADHVVEITGMNGMGVALSSLVGSEASRLVKNPIKR